jgi:hypothetical protein
VEIGRVHAENLAVYGADKVWAESNRQGVRVARCTVNDPCVTLASQERCGERFTRSRPDPMTVSTGPLTWSSAVSGLRPRTGSGSPTSPT